MPRKSFLSAEFFVEASEEEARIAVCSLPSHIPQITLIKENTLAKSLRFLVENEERPVPVCIDVSILFLDNLHVCYSIHGSYINDAPIHSTIDITNTMQFFEQAINAALKNDFSTLQIKQPTAADRISSGLFARSFISLFFSKSPA